VTTDDRLAALRRTLPAGGVDQQHRIVLLATLAEMEAQTAAALSLYVQGVPGALDQLLGRGAGGLVGLPVVAAFAAAAEAITAAVGDDPTRGYAALATLQERAAEYAAAHQELIARHTGGNAG
jgi:uncharacterized protein YmfQ (DUF2313 family)